jgi:HEAT repeat protein
MVLLGRIGDREAVPELCRVLEDREAPLDALIAAVRALGRIGGRQAVPALEALVEREDLPTERQLQVSVAVANPVIEAARWQLDLAAAEALARLGTARPDLAERHARDERALVRRYAARVLEMTQDAEG